MLVAILITIVIGAVIGWLANMIVKSGLGLAGDIIVGIVGSVLGGWLLPRLGVFVGMGLLGTIISGVIGAVIILLILKMIKRA
ncbi:MAG: GlsB/YeaQ/YmgE family stress response membrane protein [Pseudomonadota bacterium]